MPPSEPRNAEPAVAPEQTANFSLDHLEHVRAGMLRTNPSLLENLVLSLLTQYFYHVSDKAIVQVLPAVAGGPTSLNLLAPTQFRGRGRIRLSGSTVLGWRQSPDAYACGYLEARSEQSLIEIGAGTAINNRAVIISDGAGIHIGERCAIGQEFTVLDSNFHEVNLDRRHLADQQPLAVHIGNDVFIGGRVTILKGCRIGDGSAIAAGSVLPPKFQAPPLSIVAGNPAKVVGQVKTVST
ncbi:MAG TPA: acyltransferase [Burkholderiaceae bacterium]